MAGGRGRAAHPPPTATNLACIDPIPIHRHQPPTPTSWTSRTGIRCLPKAAEGSGGRNTTSTIILIFAVLVMPMVTTPIDIASMWQQHHRITALHILHRRNVIMMVGNSTNNHHRYHRQELAKLTNRKDTKKRSPSHNSFVRFPPKSECKNVSHSTDHPPMTHCAMPIMVVSSSIVVHDAVMQTRQKILSMKCYWYRNRSNHHLQAISHNVLVTNNHTTSGRNTIDFHTSMFQSRHGQPC